MSEPTGKTATGGVKTLGVKLFDELHAQFAMVAQLNGLSLNDAVLQAVTEYIDRNRGEADFAERAAAALAEVEREAAARREAIQALFGAKVPDAAASAEPLKRRRESTQ